MKGYKTYSNHEKESLHREAQEFVQRFADEHNPDLNIAGYTESSEGQNYLSSRCKGINRFRLVDFVERLSREFPGADLFLETGGNPVNLYLELPIVSEVSAGHEYERVARRVSVSKKPEPVVGMLYFMLLVINVMFLLYRFKTGTSGF